MESGWVKVCRSRSDKIAEVVGDVCDMSIGELGVGGIKKEPIVQEEKATLSSDKYWVVLKLLNTRIGP